MAELPRRLHTYQNHHLDGPRWDAYTPRPDDIIISTSYKAGTTLMQTIVANLLFPDGNLPDSAMNLSPWLDMRVRPFAATIAQIEAMTYRRFLKTHLPLDGLPYFEQVKYICVSRDPRDVFASLLNHWNAYTEQTYEGLNGGDRVGDPFPRFHDDLKRMWRDWISRGWFDWEEDGYPYWSHTQNGLSFWEYRHLPNIYMAHYSDLRADLDGEMRRLAAWLEIEVPEEQWPDVVSRCRFETVKKDPSKVVSSEIGSIFKGGGDTFINKGTNGRWKDFLDADDMALFDERMAKLPSDFAHWLVHDG